MMIDLQHCEPANVMRKIQQLKAKQQEILSKTQIADLYNDLTLFVTSYIKSYPSCIVDNGCDYTFHKGVSMDKKYRVNMAKLMYKDVSIRTPLINGVDLIHALAFRNRNDRLYEYIPQSGDILDTSTCFHKINLALAPESYLKHLTSNLHNFTVYCYANGNWSAVDRFVHKGTSLAETRPATTDDLIRFDKIVWFTYDVLEASKSLRKHEKIQMRPHKPEFLQQAWAMHLIAYYLDCDNLDMNVFALQHWYNDPYSSLNKDDYQEIYYLLRYIRKFQEKYFEATQNKMINSDPSTWYHQLLRRVDGSDTQVTDYFDLATKVSWAYTHDLNKTFSFLIHQLKLARNGLHATF